MAPDLLLKAVIAAAPVLLLLFVFDRLDAFDLVTLRAIAQLAGAGGLAAAASFLVNWGALDGLSIGFGIYSRYLAPIIEETLKAAPIMFLFASNRIGFKLDAGIAGFAIGAGFAVVENGWFLIAQPETNLSAWLVRGLGTAVMHGGATALFAVVSHEMTERQAEADAAHYRFKPWLFAPGLVAAIVAHSAFNHFPPTAVMALSLVLVPLGLFLVFARSDTATRQWLAADLEAHRAMLEAIRSGRFAESERGAALNALAESFQGAIRADIHAYVDLKTELILRAEETLLAAQSGEKIVLTEDDRRKVEQLGALEHRLGASVLAALAPRLGFSRNDVWELDRFSARARLVSPRLA